ncbi:hypothetical protein LY78DRAFT_708194 [Colletotrichum sublineola]|nr:hypothetical protein LY78DRAFT_708194 [Colletotrichum sublineola]
MSCDVRPVITSTKNLYVNPYDTPPSCPCAPLPPSPSPRGRRHHTSDRCTSHGCCTLDVAIHRCARRCRNPTKYNRYLRASCVPAYPYSSPHPSKPLPPDFPFKTRANPRAPSWRRLRIFDRAPDFCAVESRAFRLALAELLDIGRVLPHAEAELEKARLRIERERARHRDAHGAACETRVFLLRGWEEEEEEEEEPCCGWTRRVADMDVGADDLALSTEVLADCWGRYVGLLRRYEELGQRRVGGIVEDRGRRRGSRPWGGENDRQETLRDEEARPWRYVRRESWDREDRNREGHREEGRAREVWCQPEPVVSRRHSVRFEDEVVPRRRKSQDGSPDNGKRHRSWWRF